MRELSSGDIEALAKGGEWKLGKALFVLGCVVGGLALVGVGYKRALSDATCARLEEMVASAANHELGRAPTTTSILAARSAVEATADQARFGPSQVVVAVERRSPDQPTPPGAFILVIDVSAGDCHATYEHPLDSAPSPQDLAVLASKGIVEQSRNATGHSHGE